jgi:hypothetical protein
VFVDNRDLLPGDVGFSIIGGRTGALVNLGQALLRDSCRFTHAYLVLDNAEAIEAMPRGARLASTSDRVGDDFLYFRLPLLDIQRQAVTSVGRGLVGTPYSFLDYYALGAQQWGFLPGGEWARRRVADSGHMICSQLVDFALHEAGCWLFDDGRLPQDVTPGDLFWRLFEVGSPFRLAPSLPTW